MIEAEHSTEDLPRIYTSRQVFGFDLVESLATKQVGEAMFLEAYKQRAKILREIERELPDHVIDPRAVLLEIGVQYLVETRTQGHAHDA